MIETQAAAETRTQALEFLEALWGEKEKTGEILIWSGIYDPKLKALGSKRPIWAGNAKLAENLVRKELEGRLPREVYCGVGLRKKALPSPQRGSVQDICAVAGLWADVDIDSPVHAGKNYPPDQEAVMKIIDSLGKPPTLTIDSGHGFQFWWLFKELYYFGEEDARVSEEADRLRFAALSGAWQRLIRLRAKQIGGWDIDSTGDLARVLRVPGTWNNKGELAKPVRLIKSDGQRYARLEDFEGLIGDQAQAQAQIATDFTVNMDSAPDPDKFRVLCEVEPRFAKAWEHNRPDIDQSNSGYEMSLAYWAAQAGWKDQEIADLLIYHRRRWDPSKLKKLVERKDYIGRTINRARTLPESGLKEKGIINEQRAREGPDGVEPPADNTNLYEALVRSFGDLQITRIVKYAKTDCDYVFFTQNEGRIVIKTKVLFSNPLTVQFVSEFTKGRCMPQSVKPPVWARTVKIVLDVCEEIDIPEASEGGRVENWLEGYLESSPPLTKDEDVGDGIYGGQSLLIEGRLFVNMTQLRRYIQDQQGERVAPKTMGTLLRMAGFQQTSRSFVDPNGLRRPRKYWSAPWTQE